MFLFSLRLVRVGESERELSVRERIEAGSHGRKEGKKEDEIRLIYSRFFSFLLVYWDKFGEAMHIGFDLTEEILFASKFELIKAIRQIY